MTIVLVVETTVLIALCVLVAGLLRSYATVLQRLHQLDGGQTSSPPPFRTAQGVVPARSGSPRTAHQPEWGPAHDLTGVGLDSEVISLRILGAGRDTVLVFLSSGCAGCTGFWDDFAQRREGSLVRDGRIVVVTKDPDAESISSLREICPPGVDLVMSSRAWEDYEVPGSPYVVVVDGPSGRVKGEGSGTSLTQVSGLVHQSSSDLDSSVPGGPRSKPRADADREVDVDRVLLAAGISPGHHSLYRSAQENVSGTEAELIGFPGMRSEHSR